MNDGIVPSVLPSVPNQILTISYNEKIVNLGNEFQPQETKIQPKIEWDSNPNQYYTLYMFDPDAPSRSFPALGDVVHWLVGNIKGNDLNSGQVVAEYRGCGPPRGTGLHRYIFILFQHEEKIDFQESCKSLLQRMRFFTEKFRKKYKLDEIVAWNYFKSQWCSQESKSCVCM